MSRYSDYGDYDDPEYNNAYELWQNALHRALNGKRGQQALRDLREALLALPERRLIERALCTMSRTPEELRHLETEEITDQGVGVCAVGAYAWHQKLKSGMTAEEAFASLPTLPDSDSTIWETANYGREAGLRITVAEHLAYLNDEKWRGLSPEDRWQACMKWVEKLLIPVPV